MAKYGKQLTEHLRRLAHEAETIDDDGAVVTKGEALARLLFKKALGYTEKKLVKETGEEVEEVYRPEPWAIQLIWDRIEGKTPVAEPDQQQTMTAAEKVSELSKARMNRMAGATADKPKPLPPKLGEKQDSDGENPENPEDGSSD